MNAKDALVHTTVRLECTSADGECSSGTGFFFSFCEHESDEWHVPVVITNKHVVAGANSIAFHLSTKDTTENPQYGRHIPVTLEEIEKNSVQHPDPGIDLVAILLGPVLYSAKEAGIRPFYRSAGREHIADAEFMRGLTAVEDVLMIGYPNGLWDSRNNLPIVRRGITATPPYIDFDNRPEFLIDCACFPGSSGSPVILANFGTFVGKDSRVMLGDRFMFLGILWAGPQYTTEGEVKTVPVPTTDRQVVHSPIPTNLGYCIKAEQLLAFEHLFATWVTPEIAAARAAKEGATESGSPSADDEEHDS